MKHHSAEAAALDSLRILCGAAVSSVPSAGAAVSVMTVGGHSGLVHATDPVAERLEEIQFSLGEGPAVTAFSEGYPVLIEDVAAERGRWPAFVQAAEAVEARAVFALPLQLGAIRVGVFLLYRGETGPLRADGLARALRLADAITAEVVNLVPGIAQGSIPQQPEAGLQPSDSTVETTPFDESVLRSVVHQATGMLAMQLDIGLDEALARLRARAYAENTTIIEIARAVVARTLQLER